MENTQRRKTLLAAFILGILVLVGLGWTVYLSINLFTLEDRLYESYLEQGRVSDRAEFDEWVEENLIFFGGNLEQRRKNNLRNMVIVLIAFIISIPAVLLNILGWLKNDGKKALIAAILYVLSLNVISAILCFVGRAKLKKAQV